MNKIEFDLQKLEFAFTNERRKFLLTINVASDNKSSLSD